MTLDEYFKSGGSFVGHSDASMTQIIWDAATLAERKECAQVCGDRAKAASIACDAGAYYEAEECEDAILKRPNGKLRVIGHLGWIIHLWSIAQ